MTMKLSETLQDGSTVVIDDEDAAVFVLKPGDWETVLTYPVTQRRAEVESLVLSNRVTGNPRTALDEQAMQTAHDAQTGEAHEQQEEAR